MHRALECGCDRWTIQAGLACRRRLLQKREHPVAEIRAIKRLGSWPRRIQQSGQPVLGKALPPLDDSIGASATDTGNLLNSLASQTAQDNLSSFDHLFRFGPTPANRSNSCRSSGPQVMVGAFRAMNGTIQYIVYHCK